MATQVLPNGEVKTIDPKGKTFTLEELYEHTQSTIVERLVGRDGTEFWLDEEGIMNHKAPNPKATGYALDLGLTLQRTLLGVVLMCAPGEVE